MFHLPNALTQDCFFIKTLELSQVLLKNDARFLWIILVPERENVQEIYDLCKKDQSLLWEEIIKISPLVKSLGHGDKLNVGALGNVVSTLHIHLIARRKTDALWPNPVWGDPHCLPYAVSEKDALVQKLQREISETFS